MNNPVFIYGTFKKGHYNHYLIEDSDFLGSGRTIEPFALFIDRLPYVTKELPLIQIQGEVYSVDDATLTDLDLLNGHPDIYCREMVDIHLHANSAIVRAWLYFNPGCKGVLAVSGEYALEEK